MGVDVYWHDRTGARKIKANFRKEGWWERVRVCIV